MATKAQKDAEKADEVTTTSETVPAGTVTTSDKDADVEVPTKVEENDEAKAQAEKQDEVLDVDYTGGTDSDFPGALGTVKEGNYDVPWAYLTADDFDDEDYPTARTADSDDPDVVKWNVQHAFETEDKDDVVVLVPVQATPGQTFTLAELPDIAAMEKAGINVKQFLSGLPVRADFGDDEPQRRGIPA